VGLTYTQYTIPQLEEEIIEPLKKALERWVTIEAELINAGMTTVYASWTDTQRVSLDRINGSARELMLSLDNQINSFRKGVPCQIEVDQQKRERIKQNRVKKSVAKKAPKR
jgi:hypothetical protein